MDPITAMQEKLCEASHYNDHYANMFYMDMILAGYSSADILEAFYV